MFDTIALSNDLHHQPNFDLLIEKGSIPRHSPYTGRICKFILNGEKDAKEPRITISKSPMGIWTTKAEVSCGGWFRGSSLYLPDENDLKILFPILSIFVEDKTGLPFDAYNARTTRLDVTRDFRIGEALVAITLKELKKVSIPKYLCKPINDHSVYFESESKIKAYNTYSKFDELIKKKASEAEIENGRGVLRLEVVHKNNRAVANLSKSLKIPYHFAAQMLTRNVSEVVIANAMKLLNLKTIMGDRSENNLELLANNFDNSMPLLLAGHLAFKKKFGLDYAKILGIDLSAQTIKKYDRMLSKKGILSL